MSTPVQLKGWLCASAFFAAFAVIPCARAANPPTAPGPTIPKTSESTVKLSGAKKVERLLLTPPSFSVAAERERTERRILGLRLPAFIALGLGGLSAGGAIATGVAANNRGNDPRSCDSRCADHAISTKSLFISTGILTGVAAAGVGLGFAFIIGTPGRRDRSVPPPTLGFSVSSHKAVARVRWRF